MTVKNVLLQNFRNHQKTRFSFAPTTVIIGPNTVGKTNILEAFYILSFGKSFRAENDRDTIQEGKDFFRIEATIADETDTKTLTVIFAASAKYLSKKFLVNKVARRHIDFAAQFFTVLFTPQDIEIITDAPSLRRNYINSILYQAGKPYRQTLLTYEKCLRQRNRMLYDLKDGRKDYRASDFDYWDNILIENGNFLTKKREEFVNFVNSSKKDMFDFKVFYDKSIISTERLFKYHFQERLAGMTLVGPQRDDFVFLFQTKRNVAPNVTSKKVSEFGSRGEQRLTILQMKLLEIEYLRQTTNDKPILLLDDIFSELDDKNINKIFDYIYNQQTIITTTHREFVPKKILNKKEVEIIEL